MSSFRTYQAAAQARDWNNRITLRINQLNKVLAVALLPVTGSIFLDFQAAANKFSNAAPEVLSTDPQTPVAPKVHDNGFISDEIWDRMNRNKLLCGIDDEGRAVLVAQGPFNLHAQNIQFEAFSQPDAQGRLGYCSFTYFHKGMNVDVYDYAYAVPKELALETI